MAPTRAGAEARAGLPDPASFRDPSGRVVWRGDAVQREIAAAAAPFFRELLASEVFARLMASGAVVSTWIARDDAEGLVLGHQTLRPVTYPSEWPGLLLHDAARLVLQVAEELAAAGLGLVDGHPWNVLVHRGRPTFIDVGSIAPAPPRLLWPGHQQFLSGCVYPLHLRRAGLPELATARLQDLSLGVSDALALRALPIGYLAANPGLWLGLGLRRWLTLGSRPTAPAPASGPLPDADTMRRVRGHFFAGLRRELEGLRPRPSASAWSGYYATCPGMTGEEQATKLHVVERLLAAWRPATVLDLGCNTGAYATLAARAGASVVALDQDEEALSRLYEQSRREGLDILPLHVNLCNPSSGSGWNGRERPGTWERLSADVTLMLALLHHLLITHQLEVEHVADLVDRVSRRRALIEWVALDDPMSQVLAATATRSFPRYELGLLVAALAERGFAMGEVVPLTATRRLVVFERA